MIKYLLYLYIGLMPFLHAFSPTPVTSMNVIVLVCAIPLLILTRSNSSLEFRRSNIIVAMLVIYGFMAWLWYPTSVGLDRWQGGLQWAFSLIFLWGVLRYWLVASRITFLEISKVCFYAATFLSAATVFEFILVNNSGKYISDYLYFSITEIPVATAFGEQYIRPRVFSAEAGFTSMAFELFLPLSYFYFQRQIIAVKYVFTFFVILGAFLLFSTSTIVSFSISFIVLLLLKRDSGISRFFIVVIVSIVGWVATGGGNISYLENISFYKIADLFDASTYLLSEGSRQEALTAGWSLLTANPLGVGWGTVLQEANISGTEIDRLILGSGLINLWLELAVATGFIGVLAFAAVIGTTIRRLALSRRIETDCCMMSLAMLSLHHIAVYEVWFPMLWFAIALGQVLLASQKQMLSIQHPPSYAIV